MYITRCNIIFSTLPVSGLYGSKSSQISCFYWSRYNVNLLIRWYDVDGNERQKINNQNFFIHVFRQVSPTLGLWWTTLDQWRMKSQGYDCGCNIVSPQAEQQLVPAAEMYPMADGCFKHLTTPVSLLFPHVSLNTLKIRIFWVWINRNPFMECGLNTACSTSEVESFFLATK